uniref:NADH dehydrogenase subunit 6 n=1 Tax=Succineidae gen. n. sp. z RM-2021 TaxID=2871687 RepID=A0A977TKG1_9EUPU|nr:NADH dehydrogenase subunit 6 [Succineidae gen. n. sp. z RM-2021]
MKLDIILLSLSIILFVIFFNPLIIGFSLFMLSLVLIKNISMMSVIWFAYIMFIVYIGGLLVLFIYVCMISSNHKFRLSFSFLGLSIQFFIMGFILWMNLNFSGSILLCSSSTLMDFPLYLMYINIFFLLIVFFAVIHMIFKKNISFKIES